MNKQSLVSVVRRTTVAASHPPLSEHQVSPAGHGIFAGPQPQNEQRPPNRWEAKLWAGGGRSVPGRIRSPPSLPHDLQTATEEDEGEHPDVFGPHVRWPLDRPKSP